MAQPDFNSAVAKMAAWQSAQEELVLLERELGEAMAEYANTLESPPRDLIIRTERKREDVWRLFEVALEALDALSIARTGHTNFGTL
jgi:hypothetical protein